MAKRFFYVCLGILALAVAHHLGARSAQGQATQFRMIEDLVAVVGDRVYYLDPINDPVGWKELPWGGLDLPPVPKNTIVSYSRNGSITITDSGEGWRRVSGVWESLGFLPGVTGVENTSWGAVKARYRK
jgi:hypothetical protein